MTPVSLSDLDHIHEPTLILVLINLEHEPPILESHITLMGNKCETQFFDLDPTLKPNLTLEPKLDLNQLPESVLILEPFTIELKSTILLSHILLFDQGVKQYNSLMIFQE